MRAPQIPQLRIAVNSRCGRACFYCRPSGEGIATHAGSSLEAETVVQLCAVFKQCGVRDFKLTGGDPALWEPLVECVSRLKSEVGVPKLEVISRHPRIGDAACALQAAGLDQINLSLDTIKPELHRRITGIDDLPQLQSALRKCVSAGLPCKINTVVMRGVNEEEIPALIEYCESEGVAQLKLLDVIRDLENGSESFKNRLVQIGATSMRDLYSPLDSIKNWLGERATSKTVVLQGGLGHPMNAYTMPSGLVVMVKDHRAGAWYSTGCVSCPYYPCHDALMAIRVTADRRIQYCLLREDIADDLDSALRSGPEDLRAIIQSSLGVYENATFHSMQEVL